MIDPASLERKIVDFNARQEAKAQLLQRMAPEETAYGELIIGVDSVTFDVIIRIFGRQAGFSQDEAARLGKQLVIASKKARQLQGNRKLTLGDL